MCVYFPAKPEHTAGRLYIQVGLRAYRNIGATEFFPLNCYDKKTKKTNCMTCTTNGSVEWYARR